MRIAVLCILISILSGCTVTGVGRYYQVPSSNDKIFINAKVSGSTWESVVFIDEKNLITHTFTPFTNSTTTKKTNYKGHEIRATFKMIKSIGTSTVVIVVFVDDQLAADFVF